MSRNLPLKVFTGRTWYRTGELHHVRTTDADSRPRSTRLDAHDS